MLPAVDAALAVFIDGPGAITVVDRLAGSTRWTHAGISGLVADPLLVDNMVIGDGWSIVAADHSLRAWKLVP